MPCGLQGRKPWFRAELGASAPLRWVVGDPGASLLPGEGRLVAREPWQLHGPPSSTLDPSPDHGHPLEELGAAGRKGPEGLTEARFGSRFQEGLSTGQEQPQALGHLTESLPPSGTPDQPMAYGWRSHLGDKGQLGRGSWKSSRTGAVEPAGPSVPDWSASA